MSDQPTNWAPVTSGVEPCYRHPDVQTGVHCTRCGNPICPDCMVPAPVGFQCPDCVANARKEFRATKSGPQQIRSMSGTPATYLLLGAIIAMFVLQIVMARSLQNAVGAAFDLGAGMPAAIAYGQPWRLFTLMFLHAGFIHLALNGYGLYLFGSLIERSFGHVQVVVIFLVTGFVASATSFAMSPEDSWGTIYLGASGAIFGLFGVFVAYTYRRRNTQAGRSAFQQAIMWLIINVILGFSIPGIDWRAHMGGVVAGFAAGYAIEELSEKIGRRKAEVFAFAVLIVIGVALVVWKIGVIRDTLGPLT